MQRKSLSAVIAAAGFVLAATAAQAAPVTMDFTSGTGDNLVTYDEGGFRVRAQPGDHFENNFSTAPGVFSWHDGAANNPPNILRIDLADGSGGAFAVLDVDLVNLPVGIGGIVFRDSNGNSVTGTTPGSLSLNFMNTTFLEFQVVNTGNNAFPVSIDNLRLDTQPGSVPEPTTLALLGLGLAGLRFGRRQKA